jgi:DNA-binding NtrC family response regulator
MSDITSVIERPRGPKQIHLRKVRLDVTDGPDVGRSIELDHDVVRIGSQEGNDLVLTDDTVSRRHAEIDHTPHGVVLRDLGSTNGTWVGDVRVREVYLGAQRTFRVGQSTVAFTFVDEVVDIVPLETTRFEGLVARSVAMREVFSVLERVAPTDLTVLVTGETGTGKELVSRALHQRSARRGGPFVVFDCGAVAKNLVESELFGHERGAFTGAVAPRPGVFEQADGGTLFLDELGELPIELQPTLLRVLEQREVRRVGDRRVRPVDVRVIAATNRTLADEVAAGRFRQDLFYRLAVVELELPPLRSRVEDLGLLVEHLLGTAGFPHEVTGVTPEAMERLAAWDWPGNVRELRNTLLRALPFVDGPRIDVADLPDALRRAPADPAREPEPALSLDEARDQAMLAFERQYLTDLLDRAGGDLDVAARAAGVDRKGLTKLLRRHGLPVRG